MNIDFQKMGGLVPAIIQDSNDRSVLMLGYMNEEALSKTKESGKVHFFSRSKNRLWMKGESSGNYLMFKGVSVDCDGDALLISAEPTGPVCHSGEDTCFGNKVKSNLPILAELESVIKSRKENPSESSYTSSLFSQGLNRIIQKFGEESIEVLIEAKEEGTDRLLEESADMLYHFLVMLVEKGVGLADVLEKLEKRRR